MILFRIFFSSFLPTTQPNILMILSKLYTLMYLVCVHHQFWCVPIFTVAWPLLLPFPVWRYWCDIRRRRGRKNQLLLAAYMELWCWSQSFTLNLSGDTQRKEEEDKVFWLSLLYDLSSTAASCALAPALYKALIRQAWLCSVPETVLTDQQQRLMLPS